jgi:predicted nucleotidyltransferase
MPDLKQLPVAFDLDQIAAFRQKHHMKRLTLFGSILRDDFRPDSDVDVLVEFEPGRTPGWEFFGMQDELSGIIGRQVELNTPEDLSRYFREKVVAGAMAIYEPHGD